MKFESKKNEFVIEKHTFVKLSVWDCASITSSMVCILSKRWTHSRTQVMEKAGFERSKLYSVKGSSRS